MNSPRIPIARSRLTGRERDVAEFRRKAGNVARHIAGYPNVVGLTIGTKRVAGQPTGALSLIAHVARKGGVAPGDTIPQVVDVQTQSGTKQLKTDVNELRGIPSTLAARAGDFIWSGDNDRGTSCLTFIKNGMGYVTTNAHVVSNIARGRFFLPNVMDPADQTGPLTLGRMAYLSQFRPGRNASEDLAILETGGQDVRHLGVVGEQDAIARIDGFASDLSAPYWYNVNGMRVTLDEPEPSPNNVPTSMLVDRIFYPYVNFWKLRIRTGHIEHGHSGAVVCKGNGNDISACGILFGGVLEQNIAYAFQLQPTFRRAYDLI